MLPTISLENASSEALRTLLGNRCLRSAGLGQFNSVAQTVTITVGAKQTGDVLTVTINGVDETYTVQAGDADNDAVATALAAVLDLNADVAAAAVGAVITVTSADVDAGYTLTTAVTGAGATTTLTVAGTVQAVRQVETDNAIVYVIDGKLYSKAATTAIVVTGSVLPVSSFRWYTVQADTSGNITTLAQTDNVNELVAPEAGKVIIGAFKVVTDATHSFTPAVTFLTGAGITATFYNLSCVPAAGYPA